MRIGAIISVVLHAAFALAGMIAAPYLIDTSSSDMMILPLDLEIADSTNVKPVTENVSEEDKTAEAKEEESFSPAKPPPTAADEEFLPDETAAKKPDPKKAAPPPPKENARDAALKTLSQTIGKINLDTPDAKPAPKPSTSNVPDAGGPRKGAGDQKRMSATIADMIMSQLLARDCWTSQADMADARRLNVVIEVQFGRDGRFSTSPKLVRPTQEPTNDPPLQVYLTRARTGLAKCNTIGFQVPKEYFEYNPPLVIELEFKPGK